uniref:DUF38 domain-containing protein n=1 Tax=Panagrolaimus sp. ES5 TaxID=591445 RepID=A0AC34G4A2_9BILA
MALKLMQICQYFQHQEFPYFVVKLLWGENDQWVYKSLSKWDNKDVDIKALTKPLWINERLQVSGDTCLIPFSKIAVCDVECLILECQTITIEEFEILTGSGNVTALHLTKSFIQDKNGDNVPLEDIIEAVPKIELLRILHSTNSFVFHQKSAVEMLLPSSLKKLILWNVIEDFNIEECFKLIKKNQQINFRLYSYYEWTTEVTKTIQMLTDNLIEAWLPENEPPNISFQGQTFESKEKLRNLNVSHRTHKMSI